MPDEDRIDAASADVHDVTGFERADRSIDERAGGTSVDEIVRMAW